MTAGFHTARCVDSHTFRVCLLHANLKKESNNNNSGCGPQAIEAFALMVKTTAQTLQAFGTELAETELPNDAEATTNLLHAHTSKKDKRKVNRRFYFLFFINVNQRFDK